MTIEWRDVPGLEGEYQVNSIGNVRSLDRYQVVANRWGTTTRRFLRGKELNLIPHNEGYVTVRIHSKNELVHRLVAIAFLTGEIKPEVNHMNGQRNDNRIENLEYVTPSENQLHANRELPRKADPRKKAILLTDGDGNETKHPSILSAATALSVSPGSILSALRLPHRCRGNLVTYARFP